MDLLHYNADRDAEILALADAHVHGMLSSEMVERLEQLVVSDPQARQRYVEYLQDSYHLHRLAVHALAEEGLVEEGESEVEGRDLETAVHQSPTTDHYPLGINSNLPSPISIVLDSSPSLHSPLSSIPSFVGSWAFANLFSLLVIGLGLLGAWFYQIEIPRSIAHSGRSRFAPVETLAEDQRLAYVGRISGMVDCKGEKKGSKSNVRGPLAANQKSEIVNPKSPVVLGDQFRLISGLLEITYDTGAKVILQGPCDYKVESHDGGFLASGKLTARLEKKGSEVRGQGSENVASKEGSGVRGQGAGKVAGGQWSLASETNPKSRNPKIPNPQSLAPVFAVRTPTATIADLGTEFGVEVSSTGVVETCVFDGRVRVTVIGQNGGAAASQEFSRGEAVRVVPHEFVLRPMSLKTGQFVRDLPRVGTIRDSFDAEHNYLKDGTAGTVWSGILNADKALRLDTLPVDLGGERTSGLLTIGVKQDSWAGWAQPHRDRTWNNAPYLFVNVAKGDFEARVRIRTQTVGLWSVAGLMVRHEGGGFASVNCNRFSADGGVQFATRGNWTDVDTDNAVMADVDKDVALRLVRMGDTFLASGSTDNGQTWKALDWGEGKNSMGGTVLRMPKMAGAVQVGLWYGTFNPTPGEASFQNFIIERRK